MGVWSRGSYLLRFLQFVACTNSLKVVPQEALLARRNVGSFGIVTLNPSIHLYRYSDLHAFLREEWEAGFLNGWDANDLVTLLHTWQVADVSTIRDNGDLGKSLSAIKAKGLIMPCKTDLYFPVSLY